MKIDIPCRVGDTVWGISHAGNHRLVNSGIVSEIYFPDESMNPIIKVRKVCSGRWGEKVFATEEEANKAIERSQGGRCENEQRN